MGSQVVATVSHRTVGRGVDQHVGLWGHKLWLLSHTEPWVTQNGGSRGRSTCRVVGSQVVATVSHRTVGHGVDQHVGLIIDNLFCIA